MRSAFRVTFFFIFLSMMLQATTRGQVFVQDNSSKDEETEQLRKPKRQWDSPFALKHLFTEMFLAARWRSDQQNQTTLRSSNLTLVGQWAWGPCQAVAIKGNYAFIGNGQLFQILDISNKSLPKSIAELAVEGLVYRIHIQNSLAFVVTGLRFYVINISNPLQPREIGKVEISGLPLRLAVVDSFAYVTSFTGVMEVVDITKPSQPVLRGGITTGGEWPICLAAKDRYVYIGNLEWPNLVVADATNPDKLTRRLVSLGGWGLTAFLQDTLLYIGTHEFNGKRSLQILSVARSNSPVALGNVVIGDSTAKDIESIVVEGKYAFVATRYSGIYTLDVSNSRQPIILKNFRGAGFSADGGTLTAYNKYLFLASYSIGLRIIDAVKPDSLRELSFFITGGDGTIGVALKNQYALTAQRNAGLAVIDVSNATKPKRVGAVLLGGECLDVAVKGNYAYVVDKGLRAIDISNPQSPKNLDYVPITGSPIKVVIANNRAYVIAANRGIEMFDISNPAIPARLGFYPKLQCYRMAAQGNFAYLAVVDTGLVIVDVSDPQRPIEVSRTLRSAHGVVVRNQLAYVAIDTGLAIMNIANPKSPRVLSRIGARAGSFTKGEIDLALSENSLYLSHSKLFAINVYDPTKPRIIGLFTPVFGQSLAASGQYIYLGDLAAGLKIIKNDLVSSMHVVENDPIANYYLGQNYPNPFNPLTTIQFSIPQKELVTIEVFNLAGQKVMTLLKGNFGPGKHQIAFDASSLPSGVYVYKITTPTIALTKKMAVVK